jgi:hypothetical protein
VRPKRTCSADREGVMLARRTNAKSMRRMAEDPGARKDG